MACKRQLGFRGEDAHAPSVVALFRGKDENRLGVVELASDRLHLLVGEPARSRNYGERISTVNVIGEYVGGVEVVRHALKKMRNPWLGGYLALNTLSGSA